MFKSIRLLAVLAVFPLSAMAQGSGVINPVYRRAQTLVNDGNATAGRALVDSMIGAAAQGSNEYAEGVYWRAVFAATAADAEMDYRRIVVDYPQSPRVEDALVRLAQLEIARANYDGALRHLTTLIAEYPQSPSRGRAGYWIARALFDKNDIQGGCVATADALARTSEDDAELRNQITYLKQRCAGVALTAPAAPVVAGPAPVVSSPVVDTAARPIVEKPAVTVVPAPVETRPVLKEAPASVTTIPPAVKPKHQPAKPVATEKAIPPASTTTSGTGNWSVQVAAYNVKSQAAAMVTRLKQRGYEARVDGERAPFRVRIGKYATAAQASAVQRSLKAKQITGFVVQAETQ